MVETTRLSRCKVEWKHEGASFWTIPAH